MNWSDVTNPIGGARLPLTDGLRVTPPSRRDGRDGERLSERPTELPALAGKNRSEHNSADR